MKLLLSAVCCLLFGAFPCSIAKDAEKGITSKIPPFEHMYGVKLKALIVVTEALGKEHIPIENFDFAIIDKGDKWMVYVTRYDYKLKVHIPGGDAYSVSKQTYKILKRQSEGAAELN